MAAIDGPIWQVGLAGGVGPPGWLGSAIDPSSATTFYSPLHDFHLDPPDLSAEMLDRCRVVSGRENILANTGIAQHTNLLTSDECRLYSDGDWVCVTGRVADAEALLAVGRPRFEDTRVGVFKFWWETAEAREDADLNSAAASLFCHEMALRGHVGVVMSTSDSALIERFGTNQQLIKTPSQMLAVLGLENMIEA